LEVFAFSWGYRQLGFWTAKMICSKALGKEHPFEMMKSIAKILIISMGGGKFQPIWKVI
jgi:hypothetical protein